MINAQIASFHCEPSAETVSLFPPFFFRFMPSVFDLVFLYSFVTCFFTLLYSFFLFVKLILKKKNTNKCRRSDFGFVDERISTAYIVTVRWRAAIKMAESCLLMNDFFFTLFDLSRRTYELRAFYIFAVSF